jgi:putative transposase
MADFYRRHLPHYQPTDGNFHVVFRLDGTLPMEVIERLKRERELEEESAVRIRNIAERVERIREIHDSFFFKFDAILDGSTTGPKWLSNPHVAEMVCEAMKFRDGKQYDLFAYTVFSTVGRIADSTKGRFDLPHWNLNESTKSGGRIGDSPYVVTKILQDLKKYTAVHSNRALHREGQFWQRESYDHLIRDNKELEKTIWYVLDNPTKVGFVDEWTKWKWTYVKDGLV